MTWKTCLFAMLAGCIDGAPPSPPDASQGAGPSAADTVGDFSRLIAADPPPNDCALLPCTGACSLACDPEKMAEQYLPPGVCATFACPLSDGRTMIVGACHYR